jgi:hypothetical protein
MQALRSSGVTLLLAARRLIDATRGDLLRRCAVCGGRHCVRNVRPTLDGESASERVLQGLLVGPGVWRHVHFRVKHMPRCAWMRVQRLIPGRIPMLRCRLVCVTLLLAILPSMAAALDTNLEGYKDFKFGMSKEELNKVERLSGCTDQQFSHICRTPGPIIVDTATSLDLWFYEDKLYKVSISIHFAKDKSSKERVGKYFELMSVLEGKYGKPDEVKDEARTVADVTFGGKDMNARWYGPGRKTLLSTLMWGDDDHEIAMVVSYLDMIGAKRAVDAARQRAGVARKADADKL